MWNRKKNRKKIISQKFFKLKIKEKIFESVEELSFFQTKIENETSLKNKGASWRSLETFRKLLSTTNSLSICHPYIQSYKKEVILGFNALYVYFKSFIIVTVYF